MSQTNSARNLNFIGRRDVDESTTTTDQSTAKFDEAEIIIGKHRNGSTGTVHLAFQGPWLRFVNLAPESAYHADYH